MGRIVVSGRQVRSARRSSGCHDRDRGAADQVQVFGLAAMSHSTHLATPSRLVLKVAVAVPIAKP
jgi:hypothetical protein